MRAVAIDKDMCQLMGINVTAVIGVTFFIGSALAAAAGTMAGAYYGSIWYFMGFLIGLKAFTAAVIGGIGSIPGAMLGGLVLGLLEAFGTQIPGIGSEWKDVFSFVGADPGAGVQADRPARPVRAGAHVMREEQARRERGFSGRSSAVLEPAAIAPDRYRRPAGAVHGRGPVRRSGSTRPSS